MTSTDRPAQLALPFPGPILLRCQCCGAIRHDVEFYIQQGCRLERCCVACLLPRKRAAVQRYRSTARGQAATNAASERWRLENKARVERHRAINRAIEAGLLDRHPRCNRCASPADSYTLDPARLDMHPTPLCSRCHGTQRREVNRAGLRGCIASDNPHVISV